jgi:hypothetical protein
MNRDKQTAKKRMMFIQTEDYNFLTYNLLIFLDEMKCHNENSKFQDFRNIAYLIDFISKSADLESYEKHELHDIYFKAQLKKKIIISFNNNTSK